VITPRGPEVEALVALLNGEEWESPEQLAKALLKTSFGLFQDRKLFTVVNDGVGFSIYATEKDARSAAEKAAYLDCNVTPLWEQAALIPHVDPESNPLCICGHPKGPHDHVKGRGWCWAMGGSLKAGNTCPCTEFKAA
jgi:hypothetical protein